MSMQMASTKIQSWTPLLGMSIRTLSNASTHQSPNAIRCLLSTF
jgi:hypothetical protein